MQELYCDICGGTPIRAQVLIEGAKLLACIKCMKGGKILQRFEDSDGPVTPQHVSDYSPKSLGGNEDIVEDFAPLIRFGIQKTGLPLAVIAERIREKESYLHAIEAGRLIPTIEIAKKLEKELGVRLIEKSSSSIAPTSSSGSNPAKFSPPSLGDMLDFSKKKKKE